MKIVSVNREYLLSLTDIELLVRNQAEGDEFLTHEVIVEHLPESATLAVELFEAAKEGSDLSEFERTTKHFNGVRLLTLWMECARLARPVGDEIFYVFTKKYHQLLVKQVLELFEGKEHEPS